MQGETLLCIATRAWNSLWRDAQQIMSRIARQNRVIYFEPGRNPDRSYWSELQRNWTNVITPRIQVLHERLIVVATPPCLPYGRQNLPQPVLQVTTPVIALANARMLAHYIRRMLRALEIEQPILWLYEPRHVDLVGRCSEKLACYFNYDDMPEFTHNARIRTLMRAFDNRLCSRADIVFATSRGQVQRRALLNPYTVLIPNGVDFALFHQALDQATPVPSEMARLKPPIIGYAGWLGYQIDIDLLIRVAEAYPHCSIALVGPDCLPQDSRRQELYALPNVFFLGQQERERLPAFLKALDVALIPYVLRGHTFTVYPLKLHEYLAAGRAVVATALPELQPFQPIVRVAATHDEFTRAIGQALHNNNPQATAERVALARENTWDRRVEAIYNVLQHHPRMRQWQAVPGEQKEKAVCAGDI